MTKTMRASLFTLLALAGATTACATEVGEDGAIIAEAVNGGSSYDLQGSNAAESIRLYQFDATTLQVKYTANGATQYWNETLNPGATVRVYGNGGADTIWVLAQSLSGPNAFQFRFYGGWGSDALYCNGAKRGCWLEGDDGDDLLSGSPYADTLKGDRHNDVLHGNGGNDSLYGGWGNDQLSGGPGGDKLWGEQGKDGLWGGAGADTLLPGNDNVAEPDLWGGPGSDYLLYYDCGGNGLVDGPGDMANEGGHGCSEW